MTAEDYELATLEAFEEAITCQKDLSRFDGELSRILEKVNKSELDPKKFSVEKLFGLREAEGDARQALGAFVFEKIFRPKGSKPQNTQIHALWSHYAGIVSALRRCERQISFAWSANMLEGFVTYFLIFQRLRVEKACEESIGPDTRKKLASVWGFEDVQKILSTLRQAKDSDGLPLDLAIAASTALLHLLFTTGQFHRAARVAAETLALPGAPTVIASQASAYTGFYYNFGCSLMGLRRFKEAYEAFGRATHTTQSKSNESHAGVQLCAAIFGSTDENHSERYFDSILKPRADICGEGPAKPEIIEEFLSKVFPTSFITPVSILEDPAILREAMESSGADAVKASLLPHLVTTAEASHLRTYGLLYKELSVAKCAEIVNIPKSEVERLVMFDTWRRVTERRRSKSDTKAKYLVLSEGKLEIEVIEEPVLLLNAMLKQFLVTRQLNAHLLAPSDQPGAAPSL